MMGLTLLLVAFAAQAPAAPAPAPAAKVQAVRLSAEQVALGAPFTAEVTLQGGAREGWRADELPAASPFTLLGQSEQDGASGAVVTLRLGLYALGEHALPQLTLVSRAGARLAVPGEAKINGSSTLAKGDGKLRGLAGPRVPLVFSPLRLALAAAGLLLALGLLGAAARLIARRRASLEKRDRRELEVLLQSGCGDLEFYLALDAIVRRHLQRRHGIPALERTATELARLLPGSLPVSELRTLFGEANLVKFAARAARPGQRDKDGQLAARLLAEPRKGEPNAALS
ncbi:MAG TPA: hypothetical protein VH083_06570 [Myxococcales bacterium]|jgi:hypothetical protein|nr:hypothetical protein [Myxococcales bacterium]